MCRTSSSSHSCCGKATPALWRHIYAALPWRRGRPPAATCNCEQPSMQFVKLRSGSRNSRNRSAATAPFKLPQDLPCAAPVSAPLVLRYELRRRGQETPVDPLRTPAKSRKSQLDCPGEGGDQSPHTRAYTAPHPPTVRGTISTSTMVPCPHVPGVGEIREQGQLGKRLGERRG